MDYDSHPVPATNNKAYRSRLAEQGRAFKEVSCNVLSIVFHAVLFPMYKL